MSTQESPLVISYLNLRKSMGTIALALPFVLVIGKYVMEAPGIQSSISDYYYTCMRDVFVGALFAIGIFLASYKGYGKSDDRAANFAAVCAVTVALFPTPPSTPESADVVYGVIHFSAAAALFLTLSYFCLVLFRRTSGERSMTRKKRSRNKVYATCGCVMLGCIAGMLVYAAFLRGTFVSNLDPIFWGESISIIAFGVSWLVKGEAILKDE